MPKKDSRQLALPMAEAEGVYDERERQLNMALRVVECDLHLAQFCWWVFNVTAGGINGQLVRTYKQLAERPRGLCCSVSKARSTVSRAKALGLVTVEDQYTEKGQIANGYAIHWPGLFDLLTRRCSSVKRKPTPALTEQGGVSTRQGPVPGEHAYRGNNHLPSFRYHSPDPDPERPDPYPVEILDQLDHPAIQSGRQRFVAALPANSLQYAIYAPLTDRNLTKPRSMVEWFRRQLSAINPSTGNTEAELLLVLAAAIGAAEMKPSQLRGTRVGVFVGTLNRRAWQRVLRHVDQAHMQLAELADATIRDETLGEIPLLTYESGFTEHVTHSVKESNA